MERLKSGEERGGDRRNRKTRRYCVRVGEKRGGGERCVEEVQRREKYELKRKWQ